MNNTKTLFKKESDIEHKWYLLDARGKSVGRVAAMAASILRGKTKAIYTPGVFCGDYVVIINADKVILTGNKQKNKLYRHYTGFVGGLKTVNFDSLMKKHPEEPLMRAINGMLPYGHLGRRLIDNVKVYSGEKHPHQGQNPIVLEVK